MQIDAQPANARDWAMGYGQSVVITFRVVSGCEVVELFPEGWALNACTTIRTSTSSQGIITDCLRLRSKEVCGDLEH